MKRVALGFATCAVMLAAGIVNASAAGYCSLDPTIRIGTPVHYNLDVQLGAASTSLHVYASGTSGTTTFGGGVGLP